MAVGYGVFALKCYKKGEFLVEYAGRLIPPRDADLKPDQTYIYSFRIGMNDYW